MNLIFNTDDVKAKMKGISSGLQIPLAFFVIFDAFGCGFDASMEDIVKVRVIYYFHNLA